MNCIQNFRRIRTNRDYKELWKKINHSSYSGNFSQKETNPWKKLSLEMSSLLIDKAKDMSTIVAYDFESLYEMLQEEGNKILPVIEEQLRESNISNPQDIFKSMSRSMEIFISEVFNNVKEGLSNKTNFDLNPKIDGEDLFDLTSRSRLLFNVEAYENYLDVEINSGIFKVMFLNNLDKKGTPYEKFVVTDAQLNKNLALYKNELWEYIYSYYIKNNPNKKEGDFKLYEITPIEGEASFDIKLNESLFQILEGRDKSMYAEVLEFVVDQMHLARRTSNSNLKIFHGNQYTVAQAYIKSVLLSNFDGYLQLNHPDKINVNVEGFNTFNIPTNGEPKYKGKLSWGNKGKEWDEGASDIANYTSGLVKMISGVIPYYERKKTFSGKMGWVPELNDSTIGKANLDSIGAVFNELNPSLKFDIEINGSLQSKNIGELFLLYDENKLTFQDILEAIIPNDMLNGKEDSKKDYYKSNTLLGRNAVLNSLYQFLYGSNGVSHTVANWRSSNPNLADKIINPEVALVTHIRNTVKNTYNQIFTGSRSKFIDMIDLDAAIKSEYETLFINLNNAWKYKRVDSDEKINNFEDWIKFLRDPNKGNMVISDRTKDRYYEKFKDKFSNPNYFKDSGFVDNFKFLTSNKEYQYKELQDDGTYTDEVYSLDAMVQIALDSKSMEAALHLRELFNLSKRDSKYNILTQTKKHSGSSIPTMGVANLASLFSIAVNKTDNFFKDNEGFYKRTQQISEIIGEYTIDFDKANAKEVFKTQFIKHFLESGIVDNEQVVIPFNFSDKSTIMGIAVNTLTKLSNSPEGKNLAEMNYKEIQETLYNAQHDYYKGLISKLAKDFRSLGATIENSDSLTKNLEQMEAFLKEINSEAKILQLSPSKLLATKINEAFNRGEYLEMTEDLHYSKYGRDENEELHVNQFLKGYAQIYSNKRVFDKWTKVLEDSLLKQLSGLDSLDLDEINFSSTPMSLKDKAKALNEKFGDIVKIVETYDPSSETVFKEYKVDLHTNGELTDLVKKYLWSKNLVVSQYVNTTVRDVFLHPTSTDFIDIDLRNNFDQHINNFRKEEHERTTAFTKRMNAPGASIATYNKGKEGISLTHKVAIMTDPKAGVFNVQGTNSKQKVYDGGGFTNPFFNELLKWALPGYGLKSSQKPIAESIGKKASTLLKFATFSITNEEIRISNTADKGHYTLMKKMNNINLWDENDYIDLFTIFDKAMGSYQTIDFTQLFPNHYMEHEGTWKLFLGMEHIEGNRYKVLFNKGEKEVKINTLFDMWEAFGGEYSGTKIGKEIVYNENSIEMVSSVIMKHAIFDSDLRLKDKMISMLLPQTAVKKGATNINNYEDVYGENELSYFNFDTSFFGIQLDASHSTIGSTTNEITQVISAIAEFGAEPRLYNAVYGTIETVVKKGLDKFKLKVSDPEKFNKFLRTFVHRLENSSQINNARAIINGLQEDVEQYIPLDNKTIYKQFVSFLISETNAEFIRRKFAGSGSVLRPSYGFMQIYEGSDGKKYLADDLIRLYNNTPQNIKENLGFIIDETLPTRLKQIQKINHVLRTFEQFKSKPLDSALEIRPLDHIRISVPITFNNKVFDAGDFIDLKEYDDYFALKEALANINEEYQIERVFTKPRDLKPVDITFNQMINGKSVETSAWSLEAVEFKWLLTARKEKMLQDDRYQNFLKYIEFVDKGTQKDFNTIRTVGVTTEEKLEATENLYQVALAYVDQWIQRSFNLLSDNKTFKSYNELFLENLNIPSYNPFKDMFGMIVNGEKQIDAFLYRYNGELVNVKEITNYKHRNPENIHSNVHQKTFGLKGRESLNSINVNTFMMDLRDIDFKSSTPFDLILHNSITKEKQFIIVEDFNYRVVNGDLYKSIDADKLLKDKNAKVKPVAYKANVLLDAEEKYRISAYGEKLYELPQEYTIFKDVKGNEVLLIKAAEVETEEGIKQETSLQQLSRFIGRNSRYDYIQTKDLGYNSMKNLTSLEEDDNYLHFLESIQEGTYNLELRKFFKYKINNYKTYKSSTDVSTPKENLVKLYEEFLETQQRDTLKNFLYKVANIKNESFKRSTFSISSRIPAQGMQSFMGMDTVGFIAGDSNDVYVSHWQLFLQGSDYDIDKLYMMMFSFTNGQFDAWSPSFDMTKFEKSLNIPLPNDKVYTIYNKETFEEGFENEAGETEYNDYNKVFDIDEFLKETLDLKFLDKFILILEHLNENKDRYDFIKSEDKDLSRAVRNHQKYFSEDGFKNYIIHNLMKITNSANTQYASGTPISFGVYDRLKKQIEDSSRILSLYDGYSMGHQQEQNSVGKDVIAIAATALKDYFGLVTYYSDYYSKNNLSNQDDKFFIKKYHINGKDYIINKIAGLNNTEVASKLQNKILRDTLISILSENSSIVKPREGQTVEEAIIEIATLASTPKHDEDVALTISAILSLATDNAKELMLAKINAGVDFAGMHLYMIMLGIDPEEVTKFMISPEARDIKENIKSDIFKDKVVYSVRSKLNDLAKKYRDSFIGESVYRDPVITFYNVFMDAQELISLGSIFKVNQGSKATEEEIHKLQKQLAYTIVNQVKTFVDKSKINQTSSFIEEDSPEDTEVDILYREILKDKPYLNEIWVRDILSLGEVLELRTKPIDLNKFFDKEETNYKKAVIDYYNLIKSVFNILDVLDSLPHFKSMFNSFVVVDNLLEQSTNKRYFVKNSTKILDEIINDRKDTAFNIISKIKVNGQKDNASDYDERILSRVNDFLDNQIAFNFLKQSGIKLDLIALMDYLNLNQINLLNNNLSKIEETSYTRADLKASNLDVLSISDQYSIALFRYLMEEYIIPRAKEVHPENGFLQNYVKTKHLSYNLKHQISYYLDESNFNLLEELTLGISEMKGEGYSKIYRGEDHDNSAKSYNINILKNDSSMPEGINLLDLLTMYNLITNEGRFGGNRASLLFYRDLSDKNSISRRFLNYEKEFKHDYVDKMISRLSDKNNVYERNYMILKIFGEVDVRDKDRPLKVNFDMKGYQHMSLNRYFNYAEEGFEEALYVQRLDSKIEDTLKILRNKGITIKVNCE